MCPSFNDIHQRAESLNQSQNDTGEVPPSASANINMENSPKSADTPGGKANFPSDVQLPDHDRAVVQALQQPVFIYFAFVYCNDPVRRGLWRAISRRGFVFAIDPDSDDFDKGMQMVRSSEVPKEGHIVMACTRPFLKSQVGSVINEFKARIQAIEIKTPWDLFCLKEYYCAVAQAEEWLLELLNDNEKSESETDEGRHLLNPIQDEEETDGDDNSGDDCNSNSSDTIGLSTATTGDRFGLKPNTDVLLSRVLAGLSSQSKRADESLGAFGPGKS